MEDLDYSWISDFKTAEQIYDHFYKKPVETIDVICLYVNSNGEIISHVKEKSFMLDREGILTKDTIFKLIQKFEHHNGNNYRAEGLAKYNFTFEPADDISMDNIDASTYFRSQKLYGNVVFEDTISLFHDVNALFIIFNEKGARKRLTKYVRFHKPVRRTRRKSK